MKIGKVLIVVLILCAAAGGTYFYLHKDKGAQPEIILPSQDDSKTAAATAKPEILEALGPLATNLVAYFSMDDTLRGCLSWSRKPIAVSATDKVKIKTEGRRHYADFSEKGAMLVFDPPLALSGPFTLAAWVQTPVPAKNGVIWHGEPGGGAYLTVQDSSVSYWLGAAGKGGAYAKTRTPLSGWIHLAVVYDGQGTQAYLNGTPLEKVNDSVSTVLTTIGNNPSPEHQHWMMAAGIDEQYFFDRDLKADEITKLMKASQSDK